MPDTTLYALKANPTFTGTVTTEELAVGTALANKNLAVNGNLSVSGFYSIKPYVAFYINTTNTSTGAFTVTSFGHHTITSSMITRVGTGGMAYRITFSQAHPSGGNFGIFCTPQTDSSETWSTTYNFVNTTKIETLNAQPGAAISVWCRIPGNDQLLASGFAHGSFYCSTVP